MSWFNNMKVGTKLITGFLLVALVAAVIGIMGIIKIHQIDEADTRLYEKITVPLADLSSMSTSFQRMRINLRDIVETKDPKEHQAALDTFKSSGRRSVNARTNSRRPS